ncbi:DNA-binding XRE family transcriptional regulator [Weissella uvarum]|uniref:hypothetical protein n=1 Tax=Weissella uvarum TaxID=1479233 RepID=UPI0019609825|nr:hypothetical protein [Weissella uvarum]MBM7617163.1 DNA-binding XRE family transcriptional regulator [Weissella uvarum]MCM0595459.1 hypothetical protein [Weissella uvarum]
MDNEAEYMVNTITQFIKAHSINEATEQLGISDQTLHQFESAVAAEEFDTALSLIPSASYLNISNQADDRQI